MPIATKPVEKASNASVDSCAFWYGDMHLSVNDNTWQQSVDESTGVPNGVDVNGSLPSTFLDGSTPKAQPMEPGWSSYNAPPADSDSTDWSMRTGLTPTGGDSAAWSASMSNLSHQHQQANQQSQHLHPSPKTGTSQQTYTRAVAPMPIPERSSTEPLWRRRLNAKNSELSQLHSRMSAPDVNGSEKSLSPVSAVGNSNNGGVQPQQASTWQQNSNTNGGEGDHDFTHASPDTLRMLGVDPNSFPQTTALANVSQSNNNMALYQQAGELVTNANANANNFAAAQMAVMQAFNNDPMAQQSSANLSSSLPQYDSMNMMDYNVRQSPRAFRRSLQDGDLHMFEDSSTAAMYMGGGYRSSSDDFNLGTSSAYMSAFAPSSSGDMNSSDGSSAAMASGKGVINKVIVPTAHGAPSDAIDLRTGEAGQMRHVCPHPGCDKHFSTSGHARRHSRIHDCLRPFECPHQGCHATFTRRDNCTQHQRARHRFQLVAHRIGDEQ